MTNERDGLLAQVTSELSPPADRLSLGFWCVDHPGKVAIRGMLKFPSWDLFVQPQVLVERTMTQTELSNIMCDLETHVVTILSGLGVTVIYD